MSGHNKWSKIKHKKGASDAIKSKIFGKLTRLITVEAKKAGGNVSSPNLRAAIEKAKKANLPNDNIERAIKKATETGGTAMESILYETYGPGGVAIIIDVLTDNRNKAAQEIRHILSEFNIELAAVGSASWAFEKKTEGGWSAQTKISISPEDKESLESITDALLQNDEVQDVYTNAE
jgi:YebC/PmpR family DNA-binding regulatory protein